MKNRPKQLGIDDDSKNKEDNNKGNSNSKNKEGNNDSNNKNGNNNSKNKKGNNDSINKESKGKATQHCWELETNKDKRPKNWNKNYKLSEN